MLGCFRVEVGVMEEARRLREELRNCNLERQRVKRDLDEVKES